MKVKADDDWYRFITADTKRDYDSKINYAKTHSLYDTGSKKILNRAKELVDYIFRDTDEQTAYRSVGQYNAYVIGVHEYYSIARGSKYYH